jgi:antitoxin component YwqK of YwqJK toxin-antitoxin module
MKMKKILLSSLVLLMTSTFVLAFERVCTIEREGNVEREYCTRYGKGEVVVRTSQINGEKKQGVTKRYRSIVKGSWFPESEGNGYLWIEEMYDNDLLNGTKKVFYPSEKIKEMWQYTNDKRDGKAIYYYESGKIKAEGEFDNDYPIKSFTWYAQDGELRNGIVSDNNELASKLQFKANYVDGKREGFFEEYYPTGVMVGSGEYKDGFKEGLHKRYILGREVNYVSKEYHYKKGVKNGVGRTYHFQTKILKSEGKYVSGLKEGLHRTFHNDGKPYQEIEYENDKKHGLMKFHHMEGYLLSETPYVNDKVEGIRKIYYPDGVLKFTDTYKEGLREGESVSYAEDGKVLERKMYTSGEVIQ